MSDLPTRVLGRTGLAVSVLGYGTGSSDLRRVPPDVLESVMVSAVDAGVNLIDTAPDYVLAEEVIGRYLSPHRSRLVLATKCGCVEGPGPSIDKLPQHDYSPAHIRRGLEESLRRMRTDHVDVLQVHISPARTELEACGSVEEMIHLRDSGLVRFLGMSGTLPNIVDHIAMGVFDTFQIPYSALERDHEGVISDAAGAGAGVIVRGGVARGAPVVSEERLTRLPELMSRPLGESKSRWESRGLDDLLDGQTRMEMILRFTLSHPDVHTTIVGTTRVEHLEANLAAARRGPLSPEVYEEIKRRLD